MWNLRSTFTALKPCDYLMKAQCGKLLNRQLLAQKVKGAAQQLKRLQPTGLHPRRQDCDTFRNWWQFYANGQQPVSLVEQQRRATAKRGCVDQIKDKDAANVLQIFAASEQQDQSALYDQMYDEFVSCFACPHPCPCPSKKKKRSSTRKKAPIAAESRPKDGKTKRKLSFDISPDSASQQSRESATIRAQEYFKKVYPRDPVKKQDTRVVKTSTDKMKETVDENQDKKLDETPTEKLDTKLDEKLDGQQDGKLGKKLRLTNKKLAEMYKKRKLYLEHKHKIREQLLKNLNKKGAKNLSAKLEKKQSEKLNEKLNEHWDKRWKDKLSEQVENKLNEELRKTLNGKESGKQERKMIENKEAKTPIELMEKQLNQEYMSEMQKMKDLRYLNSHSTVTEFRGSKRKRKRSSILTSHRSSTSIPGGRASSLKDNEEMARKHEEQTRLSHLNKMSLKMSKSQMSINQQDPNMEAITALTPSVDTRLRISKVSLTSTTYLARYSRPYSETNLQEPSHTPAIEIPLSKPLASSGSVRKSEEVKPLKPFDYYSSSMFWRLSTMSQSHSNDTIDNYLTSSYPGINVMEHINGFIANNNIDIEVRLPIPKNWPRQFESRIIRRLRREKLKLRLKQQAPRPEEQQPDKKSCMKMKKGSAQLKTEPDPRIIPSCEICRTFNYTEPDQPYMIEMRKRQAREKLKNYYKNRLTIASSSRPNNQASKPRKTQSMRKALKLSSVPLSSQTDRPCKIKETQSMRKQLIECFEMLRNCQKILNNKLKQRKCNERCL